MSVDAYVRIPDDTSNLGKKVHTKQRIVGSDTVVQHVVVPVYPEDILGVFYVTTGLQTIQAAAHAVDDGFLFLINPIDSGVRMALRRLAYQGAPTTTSTRPTTILTVERFSYTGTLTGTTIPVGKRQTSDSSPIGSAYISVSGVSITPVGAPHRSFLVPAVPSGNGNTGNSNELVWTPIGDEGETMIDPGEGLIIRQSTVGSSGDDRDFIINASWLEF